ncbi:hypothetical protein MASR2M70_01650 [Bacillota bacterium]
MFSQRKSIWNSRWIYLLITAVLVTGYWFGMRQIVPGETDPPENGQVISKTDITAGANNKTDNAEGKSSFGDEAEIGVNQSDNFYLIKKINDTIEIYYYEGEGEPEYIKSTDIEFSLLGEEDQRKFSEGIIAETEEELNEILQDFGS